MFKSWINIKINYFKIINKTKKQLTIKIIIKMLLIFNQNKINNVMSKLKEINQLAEENHNLLNKLKICYKILFLNKNQLTMFKIFKILCKIKLNNITFI